MGQTSYGRFSEGWPWGRITFSIISFLETIHFIVLLDVSSFTLAPIIREREARLSANPYLYLTPLAIGTAIEPIAIFENIGEGIDNETTNAISETR